MPPEHDARRPVESPRDSEADAFDRAAFDALRRSEARYRALAETTSDFIWEMDAAGRYTYCSPQMKALWGLEPGEMLGRTPFDVMPPEDRARAMQAFGALSAQPAPFRGLYTTAFDAAGRVVHLETSGVPFFADDGRLLGFRGISRDVTDQKRMETATAKLLNTVREEKERLARQSAVAAEVARVLREALTCETEEDLGRICLAAAEELTQSPFGFVGEVNEATGRLDAIAISAPGWDAPRRNASPGDGGRPPKGFEIHGLYGAVFTRRQSFFTNEPQAHPDSTGTPLGHPALTSFLGVPLIAGDKAIGILCLGNRPAGYRPEDLEAAEALAPAIVQALLRKRAEQALRNTTRRFQTILDHAPVAIYVKDREGRFLFGNRRLEEVTGRPLDSLFGKTDYDFAPKQDADRWRENDLKVLESGAVSEFEEKGSYAAGRPYVNLSVKFPLSDDAGAAVAVCGISTDITDRKRAEAALREANEQLREMDRRKDEFIALLSHELRNPLAPIRYALPVLASASDPSAVAAAVAVIERQVVHLTRLVDDLLDVSRITTGKLELRRQRVTLADVVKAAVEAAAPGIAAGHHSLDVAVPEEPAWVCGDAARLSQVIMNLLDNAAKFTPPRGRVELTVQCDGKDAIVRVRDNGAGIPADALTRVFEMFHQVGPDRVQGGLGIGLGLVKQLVELHGGSVEANSAGVGQGAEFVVRLPLAPETEQQAAERSGSRPAAGARRLKVLVVDDNEDLVEMLALFVEGLGHHVQKAFDGQSALSAASFYRPDVVLLDLGLPGLTGLDVARELRRRPETARAHIVALTGWGQADYVRQTAAAGFDGHLTKPTDPGILEQLLAKVAGAAEAG